MTNISTAGKGMSNPMIQIREFGDGTYSIMARIWNPQKNFYEHPNLINLTEEDVRKHCLEVIKDNLTIEEIVAKWVYIGN